MIVPSKNSYGYKSLNMSMCITGQWIVWDGSHLAEVNKNINLGYSQDQGYS